MIKNIQQLPSRYEPLIRTLGDSAQTTFFEQTQDLDVMKRLIAQVRSSNQGKWMFVYHPSESGAGKTTFIHSLSVFLPDQVETVVRLPMPSSMKTAEIPSFLNSLKASNRVTVVNFDQHESLYYSEDEYRSLLVQINSVLRNRNDLLILWPVNDKGFAEKLVGLQRKIGGLSAFGATPIYQMAGLDREKFSSVLERILKVANWTLEDAALDWVELAKITADAENIGGYLDRVQAAVAARFDVGSVGFTPPKVVFVLSSGKREVRDVCRNLRRADSYYLEASRLMMYTKRSGVAEWWQERNKVLTTALPYVVSLFDAQLLAISGSSVVHSVLNFGPPELSVLAESVQKNAGNAKKVISSTELYKFSLGQEVDSREYGLSAQEETLAAYAKLQAQSKTNHRDLNMAVMKQVAAASGGFSDVKYEQQAGVNGGLFVDVVANRAGEAHFIEFHHKADGETDYNPVAIYVLGKLKEYAINYGLAKP
ncbi:hypothetical protein [Corallococcus exiguus]|uniref:hypothetical protein n=1 Tax=Corallococcus exiguus TaxID=83462 RepID=UPI0015618F79|nr:hypothetical protein [Corallococcus exiguus]NRD51610.1 hypothetical protein [Corallococcus exiguus]